MDEVTREVTPGAMTVSALLRAVERGHVGDPAMIAWFTAVLHLIRDAAAKDYSNDPVLDQCIASLENRTNDCMFWLGDDWPSRAEVIRARQHMATGHSVDVFMNVFELVSDARVRFASFNEAEFARSRVANVVHSLESIGVDLRSVDALTALHLT